MIAVETRTVELTVPADPANLDSESRVSTAHSVWSILDHGETMFHLLLMVVCVCVFCSGTAAGWSGVVSRFSL